jgi:hypothetical protein
MKDLRQFFLLKISLIMSNRMKIFNSLSHFVSISSSATAMKCPPHPPLSPEERGEGEGEKV